MHSLYLRPVVLVVVPRAAVPPPLIQQVVALRADTNFDRASMHGKYRECHSVILLGCMPKQLSISVPFLLEKFAEEH